MSQNKLMTTEWFIE